MLLILSALLFSLSSNLDNLVIGIAYGIKRIKIGIISNFIIAIVSVTGTFIAMSLGTYISRFLPNYVANGLGAGMIIILGIYFVLQSIVNMMSNNKSKDLALKDINDMVEYAEKSDLDKSGDISVKEAFFVALGLTFNNLGTGVAASITGVSIQITVIVTFILSVITILFGQALGNHVLGKLLGKYAPLLSGVLIIILGIIEFVN
ncbi:putative sporulation protein YtaF [Clostridium cavendishii DSM 21758]|uniref:Putative sporulation protein YtaF n=1 Tax=Clostridium cavendishii DSM 21758 TaxID=1121302 RepID=A0A1M6I059_9CLOT|nr:sporulation membrane protein YtaF [Clostridium cavendishii]SHJ27780.1 putative sporulation protein YtaF [Clostridium cavendishii DSM 21758]